MCVSAELQRQEHDVQCIYCTESAPSWVAQDLHGKGEDPQLLPRRNRAKQSHFVPDPIFMILNRPLACVSWIMTGEIPHD